MKHSIDLTVINDASGATTSSDGIMMVFIKAVAIDSYFSLNTGYLLTQLSDLTDMGITADYDEVYSLAVYQQVSEFYAEAGTGAYLWLVGVPKETTYADYVGTDTFKDLIRFTAQSDPANRVKMLGICYDVPIDSQDSSDFPPDVTNTVTALHATQQQMFQEGYQFSSIVDGYNMSTALKPASLRTVDNMSAYSVSVCISGTTGNGVSAVGLALGHFSQISIGQGFGAVEDGPRNITNAYLTNSVIVKSGYTLVVGKEYTVLGGSIFYNGATYKASSGTKLVKFTAVSGSTSFQSIDLGSYVMENYTPVSSLSGTSIDALGSKQYMFLRTWFGRSGYYWNDGATCESTTKQLCTQEYNRVANALSADALYFFIGEMGKNLPVNTSTAALDSVYTSAKQAQFYSTYISPLTVDSGSGDLTDGSLTVTGSNFNSTKTLNFELKIVPTPILGSVVGTVRFSATL